MRRRSLHLGAAVSVVVPFALALGMLSSCAERPDEPASAAEVAAAASETPSEPRAVQAPQPIPRPGAGEATKAEAEAARDRLPGGLTRIGEVQSDPELALDADPPGKATARWGGSGRDISGETPWRLLAHDGIHERGGDAIGVLQEPRTALRSLPRSLSGDLVDWVAALRNGAIRPRGQVGRQGRMEMLDQDIVFPDTRSMPVVVFPHLAHTEWLACGNCHDWLFEARQGANDIAMADIARGRACGLCHGKVAFPATDCFRCHSGPRPH